MILKFSILALLLLAPAWAKPLPPAWSGQVVSVHDGDTIRVLRQGKPVSIRLAFIDAPELKQAAGEASRAELADLILGKPVTVTPTTTDRYGRVVAVVQFGHLDVSRSQIDRGQAWAFRKYLSDPAPWLAAEENARKAHRGLWKAEACVSPWRWRAMRKQMSK